MNPLNDSLKEELRQAYESLKQLMSGMDERVPTAQADELRHQVAGLQSHLEATKDHIQKALDAIAEAKSPPPPSPEIAARLKGLETLKQATQKGLEADLAMLPKLPPTPKIDLLDGHTLGKILLVRLGLVQDRSTAAPKPIVDDAGFRWESSEEWERLGM